MIAYSFNEVIIEMMAEIANIIKTGKVDKDELYALATDAINVGVGFQKNFVQINLQHVMEMFEDL